MIKDEIGGNGFKDFCGILGFTSFDDGCSWLKMELTAASNNFNYFTCVVFFFLGI